MEQTVYIGSTTTDIVVYTQAIDSSGSHVALVVDTSTTKLVFANGTVSSATPTVTSLGTGKAKITFASIANSNLTAGDTVAVRVNGSADSINFSEYLISVFIATASSGGGGGGLTQADVRSAVGLASANLDTQLGDIPTVSEFNARTKPTADYFDHTSDQVAVSAVNDKTGYSLSTAPPTAAEVYAEFTSGSNEDAFKADVSGLSTFDASTDQVVASNMRGTDNALLASSAPTNWGSLSINSSGHIARVTLVDTTTTNTDMANISSLATASDLAVVDGVVDAIKLKTDQLTFTVSNQVDSNALSGGSGGDDAATIYSYFTASNREDQFKSDVSGLATSSDLATVDSNVDSIKAVTEQMVFTVSGQIDANAVTGGGGDDAATIYSYFTASNREDQFKSDVSGLATQSSVNTVDSNVDAIKAKTDELSFTIANQVDANAVTGGGTPIGAGAIAHTVTVNVGGNPADGVEVWVSTDSAGNNVVAGTLVTDAFGNATFMLEAGSYYLWAQRSGTNFTNPTSFSVS